MFLSFNDYCNDDLTLNHGDILELVGEVFWINYE